MRLSDTRSKKMSSLKKMLLLTLMHCSSVFSGEVPKIYDAFLFYNEFEVLEIKLNELYNHVDYFVLVECNETFRGDPKPLYFDENKQRFSKFLDKIIHVVVTERFKHKNPWKREAYQRNQILQGLMSCHDDDIVIIEDVDEIIRASKLPEIITSLLANRQLYVPCIQTIYTYFLNRCGHPQRYNYASGDFVNWTGSVVAKYKVVKRRSPQGIRTERYAKKPISDAGWHFSCMGGIDKVRLKLESFSHYELDKEFYKHPRKILEDIESLNLINIDETYPQYVQDNIPYFNLLGLIDQETVLSESF